MHADTEICSRLGQPVEPLYQLSLGYLAPTGTAKGLGVFASRAIEPGKVVEESPVILLRAKFDQLENDLRQRVFDWERIASVPGTSALALGYGSLYNHANPANMRYEAALDGNAIRFTAIRAIDQGEELTINYNGRGGAPDSTEDVWFPMFGMVPDEGKV